MNSRYHECCSVPAHPHTHRHRVRSWDGSAHGPLKPSALASLLATYVRTSLAWSACFQSGRAYRRHRRHSCNGERAARASQWSQRWCHRARAARRLCAAARRRPPRRGLCFAESKWAVECDRQTDLWVRSASFAVVRSAARPFVLVGCVGHSASSMLPMCDAGDALGCRHRRCNQSRQRQGSREGPPQYPHSTRRKYCAHSGQSTAQPRYVPHTVPPTYLSIYLSPG